MRKAWKVLRGVIVGIFLAVCISALVALAIYDWRGHTSFLAAIDDAAAGLLYMYLGLGGVLVLLGFAERR